MKHSITLDASDIRSTIAEYVRKHHPELCKEKTISIAFSLTHTRDGVDANSIKAEVTFADIQRSSAWD